MTVGLNRDFIDLGDSPPEKTNWGGGPLRHDEKLLDRWPNPMI